MKHRIVQMSEIAAHPHHSLSARDYIFDEEYALDLVKRGTKQAMDQLQFMIDDGQATIVQIRQVVQDKLDVDRDILEAKYATLFVRVAELKWFS